MWTCEDDDMWLTNTRFIDGTGTACEADIRLADGAIVAIESAGTANDHNSDVLDCSEYVLLPGMVNAHFHQQSTLVRGLEFGLELYDWFGESAAGRLQFGVAEWLETIATPAESRAITEYEYARLLCQGVTLVADAGMAEIPPERTHEAADSVGIRALAHTYDNDRRTADGYTVDIAAEEDLTRETIDAVVRLKTADPIFALHCLETPWRRDRVLREWGKSSVAVLAEFDLLSSRTVLYHGCEMDADDIATVARTGAAVAHCPVSNLAFGGRIAPLLAWRDAGVTVGLGTDWGDLDFWSTVRQAWLLGQRDTDRAGRLTATETLQLASRGGAMAYSRPDLGEIAVNRRADLVFLAANSLEPTFQSNEISTLSYAVVNTASAHSVRHVMVDGEFVVRNGYPTRVDLAELTATYQRLATRARAHREEGPMRND